MIVRNDNYGQFEFLVISAKIKNLFSVILDSASSAE